MVILSHTFRHSFTPFHAILTQLQLFQQFRGQFQHILYQKACTQADKFVGDTDRGPRPPNGAEGPKKEAKGTKKEAEGPV